MNWSLTAICGCGLCSGLKPAAALEDDASCWSKQTQRDHTHYACPSISARMRKRRAFADKELENVMLERELKQRQLQSDLSFSYTALVPVLHPPHMPITPGLHCCPHNNSNMHDFHFYQFFYLKSRSSTESDCTDFLLNQSSEQSRDEEEEEEVQNGWECCDRKHQPELIPSQHRLKHHDSTLSSLDVYKAPSKPTATVDSTGSANRILGSDQGFLDVPDVRAPSRTPNLFPPTAKGWCAVTPHADPVKSPDGGSGRTPAVKPLPFSVEALLRAWQAKRKVLVCLWAD